MNDLVVGMGEALWDVLPEGKKLGGAPANFAYHISQFGLNSRVVSAVGDDKLGTEILENFREKKLFGIVETVPYPTGTVQVELDAEGVPCYDIKEGVAWWLAIRVRYVSVLWRSVASCLVRQSTVSLRLCPKAMKY